MDSGRQQAWVLLQLEDRGLGEGLRILLNSVNGTKGWDTMVFFSPSPNVRHKKKREGWGDETFI